MADASKKPGFPWLLCAAAILVVIGVFAVAIPLSVRSRPTASRNSCINVLRQLVGAKEQWSLEHKIEAGHVITEAEKQNVLEYVKGGALHCEQGGSYVWGAIGENPHCTVAGHTM